MNNNLNNNVATSASTANSLPNTVGVTSQANTAVVNPVGVNSQVSTSATTPVVSAPQVNPGVVNPTTNVVSNAVNVQNAVPISNVSVQNTVPVSNVAPNNVYATNNNIGNDGVASNVYILVGTIAGIVILAAVFLLVLLVTGVIGNRNRLNCSKTTNEDGYVYTENRVYRFNDGPYYTKIDKTLIFDFSILTDEMYNEKFSNLIDNENAVTTYGFGTNIKREGNRVIITSYDPKIFDKTVNDVLVSTNVEGFTCD